MDSDLSNYVNILNQEKNEIKLILHYLLDEYQVELNNLNSYDRSTSKEEMSDYLEHLDNDIFTLIDYPGITSLLKLDDDSRTILKEFCNILKSFKGSSFRIPDDLIKQVNDKGLISNIKIELNAVMHVDMDKLNLENSIRLIRECLNALDNVNSYISNDLIDKIRKCTLRGHFASIPKIYTLLGLYNSYYYEYSQKSLSSSIIKNEYLISYSDLKLLFAKYGYDLDLVPDEITQKMLFNGDLDNIEYIFNFYKDYNVYFKENDFNCVFYLNILYKSDEGIINYLIDFCDEIGVSITELLRTHPSVFMHKSREKGNNIRVTNGSESSDINSGVFEDFEKNVMLFGSLGYNISDIVSSCFSVLQISNKKLSDNIKCFDLCGFDYTSKGGICLSAFKSPNMLSTLEQFIEFDELDYLKNNTSRFLLSPDDVIFYRLYKVKKNNKNNDDQIVYKNPNGSFKGIISRMDNNEFLLASDKYSVIGGFAFPLFDDIVLDYLNNIVKDNINCYYDDSIFEDKWVIDIDNKFNFDENSLVYDFDGVRISRIKFLRLYNLLKDKVEVNEDLILYCLTYNSILDEEEFNKVKNALGKIKGEKTSGFRIS